jgi:hypothetical protein
LRGAPAAFVIAFALGGCDTDWVLPDVLPDADISTDSEPDATVADAGVDLGADETMSLGCTSDSDCVQQSKHCDTQSGSCVDCVNDSHCREPGRPHCTPPPQEKCVACIRDGDCGVGSVCQSNSCFLSCAGDASCPASAPLCNRNSDRFVCAECLKPEDCAESGAGKFCDTNMGACVEVGSIPPADDGGNVVDSSDAAAEGSPDASARPDAADGSE